MVALSDVDPKHLQPQKVADRVGEALHNLALKDEVQSQQGSGRLGRLCRER
jgi:hypothetical protein